MNAVAGQARFPQNNVKGTLKVIHPGRSAVCIDDHEWRVIICLQSVECLDSGLIEGNATIAAGGFGAVLDFQLIASHLITAFVSVVSDDTVLVDSQSSG